MAILWIAHPNHFLVTYHFDMLWSDTRFTGSRSQGFFIWVVDAEWGHGIRHRWCRWGMLHPPPVTKTLYPLAWPCCSGFQPPECGLKRIHDDGLQETWIWTFDCQTRKKLNFLKYFWRAPMQSLIPPFINFLLKSNLGFIFEIIWQNIKLRMYEVWKEKNVWRELKLKEMLKLLPEAH